MDLVPADLIPGVKSLFIDNSNLKFFNKKNGLEYPVYKNVIAFVNPKSGGKVGTRIFESLKYFLSEDKVFDLSKGFIKEKLSLFEDNENLRILVCGGDGSIGWILSLIDQLDFICQPSIAILPLGTGNDLARIFGWGSTYNEPCCEHYKKEKLELILDGVIHSNKVNLDRWAIELKNNKNKTEKSDDKFKNELPLNIINNYFSIGIDAKVALDFHQTREKHPERFVSQNVNTLIYFQFSVKNFFNKNYCSSIAKNFLKFECDGQDLLPKMEKHKIKAVVLLNIPSYAGGSNPWAKSKEFEKQSYSDKKFEIIGFNKKNLVFVKLGGKGHSLAQGAELEIITNSPMDMQIDGEPFVLNNSAISIYYNNQASMLKYK